MCFLSSCVALPIVCPSMISCFRCSGPFFGEQTVRFLAPYYTCHSVNFQRNKAFVGLSDCRTIGPSDYRTVGLSDYRSDPHYHYWSSFNIYTLYGLILKIVHWNYSIYIIMAFSSSIRKAQNVKLCELCENETNLIWRCIQCDTILCDKCKKNPQ